MFPMAVSMAFELAVYGCVAGFLFNSYRHKCLWALYKALIAAMIAGRCVFGTVMAVLMTASGQNYTIPMFVSSTVISAAPGILLQLVLIPGIMLALKKTHYMKGMEKKEKEKPANA
ncbi:MAG: hypothetical protein HUJ54_12680 [Erysipelotrichaceae bacterium]|nr:hypothetical protein [Erysipelotrichaceae bacterium]